VGLKLNGTHQLLVYANYVNLLGSNVDNIKRNIETLIEPSEEVDQEVNEEKTEYMLLSHHQNAGKNHDLKIGKMWHESVNSGCC
jgi:hypothetical protein